MSPLHTQKSLDQLTWNEVQKIHASLGLKATAETRTRRDYQRRIVAAMPQPVVEVEQVATPLTCATCPLAILLEGDRYECGAKVTNSVTRGHWEANSDCYQEIANLEAEMTELIATPETPAPKIASKGEVQPETLIVPVESALKEAVQPVSATMPLSGVAAETENPYRYRRNKGWHSFTCWCDECNPSNPPTSVTVPEKSPQGDNGCNNGCNRVEPTTVVSQQTVDHPQSAWPQPAWYIKMMSEIRDYQKTLPDAPKPSKLYTNLCQEMEVGDYLKTDYAVTRRRTQVVAAKETLPDGRIHFILNCGINLREVFSEEVWLDAPISHQEITATQPELTATQPELHQVTAQFAPRTAATTTDDAPPNRGDNGRGRVTVLTALPEATIASIPHATKADDNFMTAFTRESESDRKFNDLAYLSQLEMEAQLAIERTVIGSEEEAIAYTHLRQIERDIEFYNHPESKPPQPSPAIQQLGIQMKELKADTLKLFKIKPFDQSILPVCNDEPEQPTIQSEPEPEGTIHWHGPLRGTITGRKGALRNFYIRPDGKIMIVMSADFTASESKNENIRHRQIRSAIESGRTFNPKAFKDSPQFLTNTENHRGIGRIMQGQDGRWWAWLDGGVTGQPFSHKNLATQYLDRVGARAKANILH